MSTALVDATQPLRPARLLPSISKSDAQRAMVLAHALGSTVELPAAAWPDDLRVLANGLSQIPKAANVLQTIDCHDGGAPFRFLMAQAAIAQGARIRFTGSPRLAERPRAALLSALVKTLGPHGFSAAELGNPWPLEITGALKTGEPRFEILASESSQFASALLLTSAVLATREHRPWTVALLGYVASEPYLDLTLHWIRAAGLFVRQNSNELTLVPGRAVTTLPPVPGDWSSIGYLLPIAWRSKSTVGMADLVAEHPDKEIVQHLRSAGLGVVERQGGIAIDGSLSGSIEASGKTCPDLLPTLAAVGCLTPGGATLRDVSILRGKESDRLEGILAMVHAYGASANLAGDELKISPAPKPPTEFSVTSNADHRMAMAAATLAVLGGCRARITDSERVSKSFPEFWTELQKVGVKVSVRQTKEHLAPP